MSKTVKVAISLPSDLLVVAERAREARGETRSEFFRLAIEAWLQREEQQAAIDQYVEGYRRCPENDDEVEEASKVAATVFALEPWE